MLKIPTYELAKVLPKKYLFRIFPIWKERLQNANFKIYVGKTFKRTLIACKSTHLLFTKLYSTEAK